MKVVDEDYIVPKRYKVFEQVLFDTFVKGKAIDIVKLLHTDPRNPISDYEFPLPEPTTVENIRYLLEYHAESIKITEIVIRVLKKLKETGLDTRHYIHLKEMEKESHERKLYIYRGQAIKLLSTKRNNK